MAFEILERRQLLTIGAVSQFALDRGDVNHDGELSPADLDVISHGIAGDFDLELDVNRDGELNSDDRLFWIESLAHTYVGDSNFDGEFSSEDIVECFIAGGYHDGLDGDESWSVGDWDGDADFTSDDFAFALSGGGYRTGRRLMHTPKIELFDQSGRLISQAGGVLTQQSLVDVHISAEPFSVVSLMMDGFESRVDTDVDGLAVFSEIVLPIGLSSLESTSYNAWGTSASTQLATIRVRNDADHDTPWGTPSKALMQQYFTSTELTAILPVGVTPVEAFGDRLELQLEKPAGRPSSLNEYSSPFVRESEPSDVTGLNDDLEDAEPIAGFGTGIGEGRTATIQGTLLPRPLLVIPSEDDGSIDRANEANISTGETMVSNARIGDGPHGTTGTGKGDFDLYAVRDVKQDQILRFDINTPVDSELDSFIYVYNAAGDRLDFNDDDGASTDSRLDFVVPDDGDYFVSVAAFGSFGPINPFDSSSGVGAISEGDYQIVISIDPEPDRDMFSIELDAGDILGVSVSQGANHITVYDEDGNERVGSGQNVSFIYARNSPLSNEGHAAAAWAADRPGTYYIAVDGGTGEYELDLIVSRPALEAAPRGTRQILYLDFDGGTVEPARLWGFGPATSDLTPMRNFLPGWGLSSDDEVAVIEAVRATVEENFRDVGLIGANGNYQADGIDGNFDLQVVTSRDFVDAHGFPVDPFGDANVSRVLVGGTIQELGFRVLGIAESIDVGNFNTAETAVVLLDLLSGPAESLNSLNRFPRADGVSIVDLIGTAVGNIVTHEAGHYLGSWHSEKSNSLVQIMDQGGNLAALVGLGEDGVFGTEDDVDVDFQVDVYAGNEGFTGTQNSIDVIAFGLSTGTTDLGMVVSETVPGQDRQVSFPPSDFVVRYLDPIASATAIDVADFAVNGHQPDAVTHTGPSEITMHYLESPVVEQGIQQIEVLEGAVRRLSDGAAAVAYSAYFGFDEQLTRPVALQPRQGLVKIPHVDLLLGFNEPVAEESISMSDLETSDGFVSTARLVDPQTVEFIIDGVVREGDLQVRLPGGAVTDEYGNFSTGFSTHYVTEIDRVPFDEVQHPSEPYGSLVYDPVMEGDISTSDDVDEFTLMVDAGQSISVALATDDVLRGRLELFRDGRLLTSAAADHAGDTVLILNDPATGRLIDGSASAFTIRVAGMLGTTGHYAVELLLNAAYESEAHTGTRNDHPADAQDLDSAFHTLRDITPDLASVVGQIRGPIVASNDFELGRLDSESWQTQTRGQGRIRVTGDFSTSEGSFALIMDADEEFAPSLNEAIWSVDLTGQARPVLAFDHVRFFDEFHPFEGEFVGSFPADGVAISADGVIWHPVFDSPSAMSESWQHYEVDLAREVADAGIEMGPMQIKFQQFDDNPAKRDGRGWDNIRIEQGDAADWYRVDLSLRSQVNVLAGVQDAGDVQIALFDSAGTEIAAGLPKLAPIINPGFEAGTLAGWTSVTEGETDLPWAISGKSGRAAIYLDVTEPQQGDFVAWNGMDASLGPTKMMLYQDVTLPNDVGFAELTWQHRVQWLYFANDARGKGFELQIRSPDTNEVIDTPFSFSTPPGNDSRNDSTGWVTPRVDLSEYLGTEIRIAFVTIVPEADTGYGQVELDAIRLDFGLPTYDNAADVIRAVEIPSSGEYLVRVQGSHGTHYNLSVTRNLGFDLEDNNSVETAQPSIPPSRDGRQWKLGHLHAGLDDSDFYAISANRGVLLIETFTPADGVGDFENTFDPLVRLYDADGREIANDDDSSDGRNSRLRYRVNRKEEGVFFVEITPSANANELGTSGEYIVSIGGSDGRVALVADADNLEEDGLAPQWVDAAFDRGAVFDEQD